MAGLYKALAEFKDRDLDLDIPKMFIIAACVGFSSDIYVFLSYTQ